MQKLNDYKINPELAKNIGVITKIVDMAISSQGLSDPNIVKVLENLPKTNIPLLDAVKEFTLYATTLEVKIENGDFIKLISDFPKTGIKELDSVKENLAKVAAVFLINNFYTGKLIKEFNPAVLSQLKTYHGVYFGYGKGDFLTKTTDLLNSPGYIYLAGDNDQDIENDIKAIRKLENNIYKDLLGR